MTLETFFEKFDQFADAPDAVAKMRELVLELAVQGKLTQQLASDDSVERLLQKIHTEKVSLVNEGLLKKAERVEPLPDNLHLPSQWRHAPLAALCVSVTDGDHLPPPKAETGVPFLVISDVRWGGIDFTGCRRVSDEYFAKLDWIRKPQERDILYTLVGSFGIPVVVRDSQPFCVQRHIGILRPSKHIELQYLAYALESKLVFRQAALVATGIAQKTVPLAGLRKIVVPLPPLAEQKRIVAKVDELMALCDRLEAQQQEREEQASQLARASLARFADAPTPANLEYLFHSSLIIPPSSLRKSILTLAVQGKLVPQAPNDEPAEDLLKRSLAERRRLKRTDATEVQPLAAEDTLGYDIPESWLWQRLDDLLVFGPTNGFSPKAVDYETPVRSLTLSATTSGRFKGEHSKFIATDVPADSDLWLRDGDILVQRGNTIEYVGVSAVYRGQPNNFVYPDLMMKLRVSSALDVGFIHLAMSHEASRDFLRSRASGTSGSMPKINQTTLKSLPLPIPPLAEQRRIVAKVEQLMALVDALETQLAASRATAANLLSALVAELTQPS